jgi:drug/metabolite transporter (DMT)-like permease
MNWLLLSFLGRISFAICNILDSHFGHANFKSAYSQTFFYNLFILALLPIYYLIWGVNPITLDLLPWIAVGGLTFFIYVIPYLQALKIADASTVVSLFTLGRAFVPPLAWLAINETLTPPEIVGFIIVLGGALWHAYEPGKANLNMRLITLMLLSGLMIAIYSICSKKIFEEIGFQSGVFYFFLADSLICLCLLANSRLRPELIEATKSFRKIAPGYSLVVIFSLLGNIFIFGAISLTKVSHVTMTAQFQALIALLLSFLVGKLGFLQNKESLTKVAIRQKLIGFVIMAAGMAVALEF